MKVQQLTAFVRDRTAVVDIEIWPYIYVKKIKAQKLKNSKIDDDVIVV